jgi:hypothetical protein
VNLRAAGARMPRVALVQDEDMAAAGSAGWLAGGIAAG